MPALSWADQSDGGLLEEILPGISSLEYEPPGSGEDEDAALLEGSDDEDIIPSAQAPPVSGAAALPHAILLEVCERAAARLSVEWPALQNAADQERDVYDGKLLGPSPDPRKQLFPVLPACAKHMRHYWRDPLNLKHGLTGLEVKDMASCGRPPLSNPRMPDTLTLLREAYCPPLQASFSVFSLLSLRLPEASYTASALSVRALNVSPLLLAYQAELLEDMSNHLEKGSPSSTLWKEIVTVNDLVLRNARQAVQACGNSMALSVAESLWSVR